MTRGAADRSFGFIRPTLSYQKIECEIRDLVRNEAYELTTHALGKIESNFYTLEDVEQSLLNGFVVKAKKDEKGLSADGKKYEIQGSNGQGHDLLSCGKIMLDDDGSYYLIISIY